MTTGVPAGGSVVLDVAQLEALLAKTFNIGLDVGRGKEQVALVRLRLSKAPLGAGPAGRIDRPRARRGDRADRRGGTTRAARRRFQRRPRPGLSPHRPAL